MTEQSGESPTKKTESSKNPSEVEPISSFIKDKKGGENDGVPAPPIEDRKIEDSGETTKPPKNTFSLIKPIKISIPLYYQNFDQFEILDFWHILYLEKVY